MAKVPALPAQVVIDKASGILDYYVHDGQPCVRMFPRKKRHPPTPQETAQWPAFTYANKIAKTLPPHVVATWKRLALGTHLTWKDMMIRAYMGATFNPPGFKPTNPDWDNPNHFLITDFSTHVGYFYLELYLTTDVPCVLWAVYFDHEAHFVPTHRIIRGAWTGDDKQLVYHHYSSHCNYYCDTPRTTHHLRFYHYNTPFHGTFIHADHGPGILRSVSQIFLEEDFT